jgi:hypothetical protein
MFLILNYVSTMGCLILFLHGNNHTIAPAFCNPSGKVAVAGIVFCSIQRQSMEPNCKGDSQRGVKCECHEIPALQEHEWLQFLVEKSTFNFLTMLVLSNAARSLRSAKKVYL